MKVLIVDDHAIVRRGLIQILVPEFPDVLITEVGNGNDAIALARKQVWDLILLDISIPGGRSGLDILKQIRADGIKVPILMLSMHPESQYAVRALKAGASGFLNKESAAEELLMAVNRVLSGKRYITSSVAEQLIDLKDGDSATEPHQQLSDREMQVLRLIASGKTVSEVAEELSLTVSTISTYRFRILEKLSLKNNAELTRYALDNNLA